MNKGNIHSQLEQEIRARDTQCIYCGIVFDMASKKTQATWEHIINDATIISYENIALCCGSCNASKGAKLLHTWIESNYCKRKNICYESVSHIVKNLLNSQ